LESNSLVWKIMSRESASVRQRLSNEEDIVPEPRDNEGLADDLGDRQAHERTVANVRVFWADRKFISRVGVYVLLASALISLLIPVRYQSVTRLMPPDSPSGMGIGMLSAITGRSGLGGASGLGGVAGDLLGTKNSGALFVGVIQSQTVQDRLIQQFNLMHVYHDGKIEDARKDLAEHTDVSEDRKSGIISIAVTDHDPKRASAMAKSYVDELDRLVAQVSTSAARRERIFLEERLKAVKGELDDSAKNFSDFASKNSAIDIPAQGRAMVEAAARLQGELIAVQSELEGLKQVYTDDNVRVRSARARMDELQKKLNEIGSAGTEGGAKADDSLFPSIRRLPILGVTYADLYRRTKIEETVFELLTQQYELAKVQEAKEIPTVKVLDAAIVPTKKTFPPRALVITLGTFLGLALAMTWIVVKTRWDAVEAGDPWKQFAMEVFTTTRASLPNFARNGSNGSNGHRPWPWRKKTEEPPEMKHEDGKPDAR
jgi:capsule polysaccharide export protein KpsE/RkpR